MLQVRQSLPDYMPFLEDGFDLQAYASKFLGTSVLADATNKSLDSSFTSNIEANSVTDSDLSVAVSRLSLSINQVEEKIHSYIIENSPQFLNDIVQVDVHRAEMQAINERIDALVQRASDAHMETHGALVALEDRQAKLEELQYVYQSANDTKRFISINSQLEERMNAVLAFECHGDSTASEDYLMHGTNLVAAASALKDLCDFIDELEAADRHELLMKSDVCKTLADLMPEAARFLYERTEDLLLVGLRMLSPDIIKYSVQAAFQMCKLEALVSALLGDLSDVISDRICMAMDLKAIGVQVQEAQPPNVASISLNVGYESRNSSLSATAASIQKWSAAIWERLHKLIVVEIAAIFDKAQVLECVLIQVHERENDLSYLEYTSKILGVEPVQHLWKSFALNFEQQSLQCMAETPLWREILVSSFPRLARIFHELDERLSVSAIDADASVQAVPLTDLRSRLESAYLQDLTKRLSDMMGHLFSAFVTPGKFILGNSEARRFAIVATGEIEAASSDQPLLTKVLACVGSAVQRIGSNIPSLVRSDGTAFLLQHTTSNSLAQNVVVINSMSVIIAQIASVASIPGVNALVLSTKKSILEPLRRILLDPFAVAIRREVMILIARIHRFKLDRASATVLAAQNDEAEASAYILELDAQLAFFRDEVLAKLQLKEWRSAWALQVSIHALHVFVLHGSLLRISEESDRLQITTDMTKLELCVSQVLAEGSKLNEAQMTLADCGPAYRALRKFRSLLFTPVESLGFTQVGDMPKLLAMEHVVSRSVSIPLSSELQRMTKPGYVEWILSLERPNGELIPQKAEEIAVSDLQAWLNTNTVHPKDKSIAACLSTYLP